MFQTGGAAGRARGIRAEARTVSLAGATVRAVRQFHADESRAVGLRQRSNDKNPTAEDECGIWQDGTRGRAGRWASTSTRSSLLTGNASLCPSLFGLTNLVRLGSLPLQNWRDGSEHMGCQLQRIRSIRVRQSSNARTALRQRIALSLGRAPANPREATISPLWGPLICTGARWIPSSVSVYLVSPFGETGLASPNLMDMYHPECHLEKSLSP